jgi:hypothetical protein
MTVVQCGFQRRRRPWKRSVSETAELAASRNSYKISIDAVLPGG